MCCCKMIAIVGIFRDHAHQRSPDGGVLIVAHTFYQGGDARFEGGPAEVGVERCGEFFGIAVEDFDGIHHRGEVLLGAGPLRDVDVRSTLCDPGLRRELIQNRLDASGLRGKSGG